MSFFKFESLVLFIKNRRFIVINIQVCEVVCSSKRSKAFELAAAYLQITKGMKETKKSFEVSMRPPKISHLFQTE